MTGPRPADLLDRTRGLLFGAAVGDALGWPQEQRSAIVGGQASRSTTPGLAFRPWVRWAGGQYSRYRDPVGAGEYSDDTQLLLATARACLHGDDWLSRLTEVELPAWPLYQRGGGRAVLSACRSWQAGTPPWHGQRTKIGAYFNAGANGVAMRIAPHAVHTLADGSPERLIARVVADGVLTHGHPRALLGAVVYALAARHTLRREGTGAYGDVVLAVSDMPQWRDPTLARAALPEGWSAAFADATGASFTTAWTDTAREMDELLAAARTSLARAGLADDAQTLAALGCFDAKRNGAGTVSAAAACYLAARASVRPSTGLLRAAFLDRADTDTLASMTAALLGALHGTDWIAPLLREVQDEGCLARTAAALVGPPPAAEATEKAYQEVDRTHWLASLAEKGSTERFVDGRTVAQVRHYGLDSRSQDVTRFVLTLNDGQSLYVDRAVKRGVPPAPVRQEPPGALPASVTRMAIHVRDLAETRKFYGEVLGLAVQGSGSVLYVTPWLALLEMSDPLDTPTAGPLQFTVQTSDPARITAMVKQHNVRVTPPGPRDIPGSLRVIDPDGHEVLVWPVEGRPAA
ncbi:ADP-ribosylglycohydrolase family protein [Streptomyces sp. ZAF1911]|uniref:ADP-ribosylglycohydrolase family protein n=1 Tax=Streptomyces sp. ZAF1911 TaxID=2944129 RepID=UPI00237A19D3|nr:ADP-ribosylglycohydrolase family protein [Streptomyces sp. ZAF1911]MDD9379517.1 ADP-ribosylglycohydrolase family protein [Streptomyces sp. ZAF1911]